ncbi:MAG: DUF4382 domain-containing protein [Armatimonadetes bacterium]|nr:DUF4382 domain-containing protein [Armatimonadota bacterium]
MRRLIALFTALLAGSFALVGCGGGASSTGSLTLFLADAPLQGVTALNITIDRIDAHLDGQWVAIETDPQTIDLLTLTQNEMMIGSAGVPSGTYTQIRLFLSSATVTDDTGTYDVTIPSAAQTGLKLNVNATVSGGGVELLLDFNVAKSLIKTGEGEYKLKPVIPVVIREQAGTIAGIAMYNGTPMADVHVVATYVAGSSYPLDTEVNTSLSMADGSFKVWALKEGMYRLDLERVEAGGMLRFIATVEDVVVTAGHDTNVGAVDLQIRLGP